MLEDERSRTLTDMHETHIKTIKTDFLTSKLTHSGLLGNAHNQANYTYNILCVVAQHTVDMRRKKRQKTNNNNNNTKLFAKRKSSNSERKMYKLFGIYFIHHCREVVDRVRKKDGLLVAGSIVFGCPRMGAK